jgi:ABC-type branched-subunit amino acid transport system ATPase component
MIELGAGFDPELTGAENILMYGALLGRNVREVRSRIEAIGEWAGLLSHLDVPVRAYSSGMIARLAFAIATDQTPDLLIVDEVLSVGDENFREKSMARVIEVMNGGCAVLLVSHDLELVKSMSARTIYLDNGIPKALGDPGEVVKAYLADV